MVRRPGGTIAWVAVFTAVGVFTACRPSPVAPELPEGTQRFPAPAIYQTWWSMTEACSGNRGSLSTIDWYVVPGVSRFDHEGQEVAGYWSRAGNRVVLAEGAVLNGALVRHEMLHALERSGAHARRAFLQRCGGVVNCLTNCLRDAGRPPAPRAGLRRVDPDAMVLDVAVDPAQPGARTRDGHFMVTVKVRNPFRDSVVVLLPASGDLAPPIGFSYTVNGEKLGVWFGERAWDADLTVFAPGETHRAIFDFRIDPKFDGSRRLPPGTYEVRGGFGPRVSESMPFVLAQ